MTSTKYSNMDGVEKAIRNIKTKVPLLVNSFEIAMRDTFTQFLEDNVFDLINDTKTQLYLKQKLAELDPTIFSQKDFNKNHIFNFLDIFSFSKIIDSSNKAKDLSLEDSHFSNFFKTFGQLYKEKLLEDTSHEIDSKDIKEYKNVYKIPELISINIGEMATLPDPSIEVPNEFPKIGVRSIDQSDLGYFEVVGESFTDGFSKIKSPVRAIFQNEESDLRQLFSTIDDRVVCIIDYKTLSRYILAIYSTIVSDLLAPVINSKNDDPDKKELLNVLKEQIPFIQWISNTDSSLFWFASRFTGITNYIALNKIFELYNQISNEEQTEEKSILKEKIRSLLIEPFENALEQAIDAIIKSCIMTYCAKVARTIDETNQFNFNEEMFLSLIEIGTEDYQYTDSKLTSVLKNVPDLEQKALLKAAYADMQDYGKGIRKRLSDFVCLSYILRNKNNKAASKLDVLARGKHGNEFQRFVKKCLYEIYSHSTYTFNHYHNIVGFKNGKYVYKKTFDLARNVLNTFINDLEIKIYLSNLFEEIKTKDSDTCLHCKSIFKNFYNGLILKYTTNGYEPITSILCLNAMKNHRAEASIYKILLYNILNIYYSLDCIRNYYKYASKNSIDRSLTEKLNYNFVQFKSFIQTLLKFKRLIGWNDNSYSKDEFDEKESLHLCFPYLEKNTSILSNGTFVENLDSNSKIYVDFEKELKTNLRYLHYLIYKKAKRSDLFNVPFYLDFGKFMNLYAIFAEIGFSHRDEISNEKVPESFYLEFDPDFELVRYLEKFSNFDSIESNSIYSNIFKSFESMKSEFNNETDKILFDNSIDPIKRIKDINKELTSFEELSLTKIAILSTEANQINEVITNSDLYTEEQKNDYQKHLNEFDQTLNKVIKCIIK